MQQRTVGGSEHSPGREVCDRRRAFGRTRWRWLWLLAAALCLWGCAYRLHLRSQGNGQKAQPASYPVEVVSSREATQPYKQIGVVHAPGAMGKEEALAELKQRARALGGEALLDIHLRAPNAAGDGGPAASPARGSWEAGVIVWTDKQAHTAAAASAPTGSQPPPPRR